MKGVARLAPVLTAIAGIISPARGGEPAGQGEAFVARLVHPDRQAREVLRLFEGARWSDPAAARAAWKQRSPDTDLGKPTEALIALFNREMAPEWRCLDDAEVRIGPEPASGELGWFVVIPRDDGTLAAAITAMHLTYPDDRPVPVDGAMKPVARLGRSGFPLACNIGPAIVVASSRDRLEQGVAIARERRPPAAAKKGAGLPGDRDSGTVFHLEPERLATLRGGSIGQRRAIEALQAFGCRQVEGGVSLEGESLVIEVSTRRDGRRQAAPGPGSSAIDVAWLESLPSDGVMVAFSTVIDPDPASWDRAFAAADRIERVDPARAGVAPLRTRLNLLAMGAGLNLEADLRPHLRGISACLLGESFRPGRPTGLLIVLHLDEPSTARRVVEQVQPRIGALAGADARSRTVSLNRRDPDVWIAWGDGVRASTAESRPAPGRSLATLCGGWAAEGRRPPSRVAAVWPARLWRPAALPGAAARALAEDPPVLWWGWSEPGREQDLFQWAGLRGRVRSFLASLPPGPAPDTRTPDRATER
jgi:hypothetical protein